MRFSSSIAIFIFCLFFSICYSQTHTWTGNAGNSDWHDQMNWDINLVPTSSSNVIVPDNFNVAIVSGTASAYTIQLNPNATLILEENLNFVVFSITPNATFTWRKGVITGGLIENDGDINIETFETKDLVSTTLNNRESIFITNSNTIRFFGTTTINNNVNGEIIIDSNGGIVEQSGAVAAINNSGLIKKLGSVTNGSFYMIFDMFNSGTIDIGENQIFLFLTSSQNFMNLNSGILQGTGTFDITSNFTNTGTVSPGEENSVGTLEIINTFSLTNPAQIMLNIDGINSGEFDAIHVFGGPSLNGNLNVILNYAPNLGDSFTILTSNFPINTCNFPSQISSTFNSIEYTFNVTCNSNSIEIQVDSFSLSISESNSNAVAFNLIPNPVSSNSYFVFSQNLVQSNATISIFNYLGNKIKTIRNLNSRTYLDSSEMSSGLYFAQLNSKQGILSVIKFIIP